MGVINMAHGELMMLGAYTTWVVQQWLPVNWSLPVAVPLAFWWPGWSVSPSNAALFVFSTAARWKPCWRPSASA
jgi:branched-subunit amino acid ABC-type transport system permease component